MGISIDVCRGLGDDSFFAPLVQLVVLRLMTCHPADITAAPAFFFG